MAKHDQTSLLIIECGILFLPVKAIVESLLSLWSFASQGSFGMKMWNSLPILQFISKRDLYLAVAMIKELLHIQTSKELFDSAVENILAISVGTLWFEVLDEAPGDLV